MLFSRVIFLPLIVDNLTATEATLVGNTLQGNAKALHGDGTVK